MRAGPAGPTLAVVAAMLAACGTTSAPPCNAEWCGGCCDAYGHCASGTSEQACGAGAAQCQVCVVPRTCALGACVLTGVGGGGGTGGGGSGGGVGGGVGGGAGGGAGGGGGGAGGGDAADAGRAWHVVPGLATRPSARYAAAMAYDPVRVRTVLFGGRGAAGYLNDTWEYGPTGWVQLTGARPTIPRSHAAMAYDPERSLTLLFGGERNEDAGAGQAPQPVLGDMWAWDGGTWAQVTGKLLPSGRSWAGLAWDAARKRLVLYGGSNGTQPLADTWEWDGTGWSLVPGAGSPPPRWVYSMAYDPGAGQTLFSSAYTPLGEQSGTWAYDGTGWSLVDGSATAPPPLVAGSLVYDGLGQQVLLVCGRSLGVLQAGTWAWDRTSATWSPGAPLPAGREWCSVAYDAQRGKLVLFGGYTASGPSSETLEY